MALEIPGFQRSWPVGATDLGSSVTVNSILCPNGYQYMFVRFSAGLLVPVTATAQNPIVGVLQNKPHAGDYATVMQSGVTRVRSSDATIVVGTPVYVDAFGMVSATVIAGRCVGVAEEASANGSGFIIAINLKPFGAVGA